MPKESIITTVLSGKWLSGKFLKKNYKVFFLVIGTFLIMTIQKYQTEALYLEAEEQRNKLNLVRTEYVNKTIELMNSTLEAELLKIIQQKGLDISVSEELPYFIEIPKAENK